MPSDEPTPSVEARDTARPLTPEFRATLQDYARDRIQAVWDDAGPVTAEVLAQHVVRAWDFAWMARQVPVALSTGIETLMRSTGYDPTEPDEYARWRRDYPEHAVEVTAGVIRLVGEEVFR